MGYFESRVQPSLLFLAPSLLTSIPKFDMRAKVCYEDSMTPQKTITVDFREIKVVAVKCVKCGGAVTIPVAVEIKKSISCPLCSRTLLSTEELDDFAAGTQLLDALRTWNDKPGRKVELTFTLSCT